MATSSFGFTFRQPGNNSFGGQIRGIIDFLIYINRNETIRHFILDFNNLRFVQPLFILALAGLGDILLRKGITFEINEPKTKGCLDYLSKIHFPYGIQPDRLASWLDVLKAYEQKRYLPIVNFPADRSEINTSLTNNLLSQINQIVKGNLSLDTEYENAVKYLLSEITDNIIEHSGNERGWLMVQYYPTTLYLDICIIDTGKSILGSYRDYGLSEINTDVIAIEKALNGISTKSIERGTGLRTSRAISLDGLAGDFLLWSGDAMYYNTTITQLPVSWHGTIVAMRIKKDVERFSIYNFI